MAREKEIVFESILREVLCSEFSKGMFSFEGYKEEAVCMNKVNDYSWEVFIGFHGNKMELMIFDNIISACLGVIQLLTPQNDALRSKLNNMFANAVIPDKIA